MCALSDIPERALVAGKTIGSRYILRAPLGKGGFGEVWKAQDNRTGDINAVKMPPHQFALNPKVVQSLRQECEVLKTLSHPNICRLLDLGKDSKYGPLLVTEFVDGTNLWTATRGMSWGDQVGVLIGVLHGLSYLHGRKIMHLDLKPANILVGANAPKLIDFGLASFSSPEHYGGTASYTAPETLQHQSRTVSADVYSLGVLMYECLTGTNPFYDNDPEEAKRRQKEDTPPPPKTLREDMPEWLSGLIMKMIRKDPKERYGIGEILEKIRMGRQAYIPDAAHAQSFAAASGKFVGRQDILQSIHNSMTSTSVPRIYRVVISGITGMGKTRLINEIKFGAQLLGVQTIVLNSSGLVSSAALRPIAEALTSPQSPVLLLVDDFDKWGDKAPALKSLLETLGTHPHPPSWIGCVMTVSQISGEKPDFVLGPFNEDELSEYLSTVAPIPDVPRMQLTRQLQSQTGGSPRHVGRLMERMVERHYFATESGQWNALLFDDVTVEVSEVFGEDAPVVSERQLLETCRRERQEGRAATAFERIVRHFDAPASDNGENECLLLIEAAECALACGRAKEAVSLFENVETNDDTTILYWKGILLSALRDLNKARIMLNKARKSMTKSGNKVLDIRIANQLARCDLLEGNYDEAVTAYRQSLARTKKLDKDKQEQIVNNELGYALLMKGQYVEALPILNTHMRLCEKTGHVRRYLNSLVQIGDCYVGMNKIPEATTMYMDAIAGARESQQIDILSHAYNQLGKVQFENNLSDMAAATLGRAIAINHAIGDLSAAAVNTTNMGLCQLRAGMTDDAKVNIEIAITFLKRCPDVVQRALVPCLIGLAEIAKQEHQREKGISCLDEAVTLANRHNIYPEYRDAIQTTRKELEESFETLA